MPTTPSFTPDAWANNDPTKPLNATRLAKLGTQYAAAMADVAADVDDDTTPIGAALSTTIGARIDPKNIVMPAGLVSFWDFTETAAPFVAKQGATQASLIDGTATPVAKSVEEGPFGPMAQITLNSWLKVPAALLGALNVGANSGSVTVAAVVSRVNTGGTCIAGIWRENGGDEARQYALWTDLGAYGGDSKVCGHVSKTGGASPKVLTPGEYLPYSRDYSASRRQLADNDLRFIAFTYDGYSVTSIIDGVPDSYTAFTESGAPNGESITYDKNPYIGPTNTGWTDGLNATPSDFNVGIAVPETNTGRGNFKIGALWVFDRALSSADLLSLHMQTRRSRPAIVLDQALPTTYDPGAKQPARLVGLSKARGAGASTTSTDSHTWYTYKATGGQPHIAYDTLANTANNVTPAIVWADFIKSIPSNQVDRITFDMLNNLTTSKVRVAVRINDRWHVSNQEFNCASTHTDPAASLGSWESFTFTWDRAAASWRRLALVPGTEMTLGTALQLPLPLGEITAIGIYTGGTGGTGTEGAIRVRNIRAYAGGVLRTTWTLPADPQPSLAYAYPGATESFDVNGLALGTQQNWTSVAGTRTFAASSTGTSPTVVIDTDGRRVLRFDDSNDLMDLMWTIGATHSFAVIGKFRAIEANAPIMASPATSQVNMVIGNPSTNYSLSAGTSLVPSPAIAPDTNRHVWMSVLNGTSSVIRIDGARQVGATGAQTRTGFRIGATSSGVACPIDIERIDIWDTAIDSTAEAAYVTAFPLT